jgi:DNA-binding NarL/FixJ family response regulator
VTKHLVTNKTKELLELTKSKQVIDTEIKVFYDNFDESFLQIYPNFITQFNALLKKDHQVILKSSDELLNSELRIYALIRLGITNSAKIAKILRYSINTIYNYRVKIKNNAIDRESFEESVKKIK